MFPYSTVPLLSSFLSFLCALETEASGCAACLNGSIPTLMETKLSQYSHVTNLIIWYRWKKELEEKVDAFLMPERDQQFRWLYLSASKFTSTLRTSQDALGISPLEVFSKLDNVYFEPLLIVVN